MLFKLFSIEILSLVVKTKINYNFTQNCHSIILQMLCAFLSKICCIYIGHFSVRMAKISILKQEVILKKNFL